ncbi:alpha/beta fold hydrolase [Poriferisphaera corsica]|nr:alpha/beta hydrolase [Poriferisphaera corsica]
MLELQYESVIDGNVVRWGKMACRDKNKGKKGGGQGGMALIAIHGTPFSSQVWRRILPHLTGRFTVYYYDLVGYGQSEMREGQDVSLGVQNGVLAGLIEEWGLERPHVLAHDFGGATALRGYYLNGLRYGSLTIFDAVALPPWGSALVQHVRKHEKAFSEMPGYMHEAMLRAYLQTAAHRTLSEEAFEIYSEPWLGEVGQAAFYRQITQMDQTYTDEVQGLYGKMDCPVKVLWGEQDEWIPYGKGEALAAMISELPCEVVRDAGHLVQEDCPEAIVAAVLGTWLRKK